MTGNQSDHLARKAQLYCVGTAKSGTHSIAEMFQDHLRSVHEPENGRLIEVILKHRSGEMSDQALKDFLVERERRLGLDVDSSQLNFFVLGQLVSLFPKARFLLTIRDPWTWLDSLINHQLSSPTTGLWQRMRDLRFRPDLYQHPAEEAALAERKLYTLNGYFGYWAHHNRAVLDLVPAERLLVVRTDGISANATGIAEFAGVRAADACLEKSHAFRAKAQHRVLQLLPQDYLECKLRQHCDELCRRYFPEILTRADVLPD